jgi:hypothetical protein
VRVDFEPWNNFGFPNVKMDITPKKLAKIVPLNEHTSKTARETASVLVVGRSSVSRILCTYMDSGALSPSRKGKCER